MSTLPPRAPGIYQIRCTPTGKIYVGSAVNLRARWQNHRWQLRAGCHHNQRLQRAWFKYGEANFIFSVLELVEPPSLLQAEQRWIDQTESTKPKFGYNILNTVGSPGDILAKVWEGFISPQGKEVTITNLQAFCREHNLDEPSMLRLFQGRSKLKSYKGWTHRNSVRQRDYTKTYTGFIDPDGAPISPVTNLAAFCREHGLETTHMLAVAHGRICSHRGWTYNTGRRKQQKVHMGFVSPDGQPTEITNLAAFCREHELNVVHMHQLKNGQRKSHKGWTWRATDEQPAT